MPRELSKEEIDRTWDVLPTGELRWLHSRKQVKAGDIAGGFNTAGYRVLSYSGHQYKIHRIIYAYYTGRWPKLIDHINGDRSDNRIENLREATHQLNSTNTNKVRGKIPYRGVSQADGKYVASVQCKGTRHFLGRFDTAEKAHDAYLSRRKELNPDLAIGG